MPVSVQRFFQAFPEFKNTDTALVQQKLDAAALRVQSATWDNLETQGVMFLAAHLLSVAPEGEQARLKKENRVTTYWLEFERMRKEATLGLGRVI